MCVIVNNVLTIYKTRFIYYSHKSLAGCIDNFMQHVLKHQ